MALYRIVLLKGTTDLRGFLVWGGGGVWESVEGVARGWAVAWQRATLRA